jgi:hypothetical protein
VRARCRGALAHVQPAHQAGTASPSAATASPVSPGAAGYGLAAEDPVTVYDSHATVLHLVGIDHTRLTFYHNVIQRRLTDIRGQVIREVLARVRPWVLQPQSN